MHQSTPRSQIHLYLAPPSLKLLLDTTHTRYVDSLRIVVTASDVSIASAHEVRFNFYSSPYIPNSQTRRVQKLRKQKCELASENHVRNSAQFLVVHHKLVEVLYAIIPWSSVHQPLRLKGGDLVLTSDNNEGGSGMGVQHCGCFLPVNASMRTRATMRREVINTKCEIDKQARK